MASGIRGKIETNESEKEKNEAPVLMNLRTRANGVAWRVSFLGLPWR